MNYITQRAIQANRSTSSKGLCHILAWRPEIKQILVTIFVIALISSAGADSWSGKLKANSSSWYIHRLSYNISFDATQSVVGSISPVEGPRGRILSPFSSSYESVKANDITLKERTGALEGSYKSEEQMKLRSSIDNEVIDIKFTKPPGTSVYTFYFPEQWPVLFTATKTMEYSGRQINDQDFEGNNNDFVGSNLLYNHELTKDRRTVMWLQRMNATVQTTDDAIVLAEFKPTKYLGYLTKIHTTGTADLSYRQSGSVYDTKRKDYPAINEGYERYYGTYDLARKIEMRSVYEEHWPLYEDDNLDNEWLPCCYSSWNPISDNKEEFEASAREVFDCNCFKAP